MRIFLLEDDPNRVAGFEIAAQGAELTHAISVEEARRKWNPPYDVVLLDHDLGGETFVDSKEENTGAEFLRTPGVIEGMRGALIVVHSYNPSGAEHMVRQVWDGGVYTVGKLAFSKRLLALVQHMVKDAKEVERAEHQGGGQRDASNQPSAG